MKPLTMREAKAHPSTDDEPLMVDATVMPASCRLGFMKGEPPVPDDFDTMFAEEIEAMFSGDAGIAPEVP